MKKIKEKTGVQKQKSTRNITLHNRQNDKNGSLQLSHIVPQYHRYCQ